MFPGWRSQVGTRTRERGHVSERSERTMGSVPGERPDDAPTSSWPRIVRRAGAALLPRRRDARRRGWSLLVPVALLLAGLLFTTTATTANGTELRDDRRPELTNL